MGRMLGNGISASALPYSRRVPKHVTMAPSEVIDLIVKFAKKGMTESQIGVLLRDKYGIP
jgi:small subunit ribosomal protein S13e